MEATYQEDSSRVEHQKNISQPMEESIEILGNSKDIAVVKSHGNDADLFRDEVFGQNSSI